MRIPTLTALCCAISTSLGAQAASPLVGAWRAELPLPNGVVQTFTFGADGKFGLAMTLDVEGHYRLDGSRLVETVSMPDGSVRTDTSDLHFGGDSLNVRDAGDLGPGKTLRRSGSPVAGASPLVGDWMIALPGGTFANYRFAPDGSMHVEAQLGDEHGSYTVTGDTLRLSDDRTFQLPASSRYSVSGEILTLTPLNNATGSRRFRRQQKR